MFQATNMSIDVSIIIPAYNREDSIVRAVNSLLEQDTKALFEVVVVDDGSKDSTAERVKSINDGRVVVVQQVNKGASAARETGVKEARGEYVAFLDSDDIAEPVYVQSLWEKLRSTPSALTAFAKVVDLDGQPSEIQLLPPLDKNDCVEDSLKALLEFGCFTVSMNLMTSRKSAIKALNGRNHIKAANDYDFCLRLALDGNYVFADIVTIKIDRRTDGITHKFGFYQVTYAVLGACEAVKLSGRKDKEIKQALSFRVSKLWPTAFGQCLAHRQYKFALTLLLKGIRWGKLRDIKQLYWSIDHYVFKRLK